MLKTRGSKDACVFLKDGRCTVQEVNGMSIEMALPGGMLLIAETWNDPNYPGIRISLRVPDCGDELLCFAEYNSAKPEGKELCIAAYSFDQDDPAYYESYNDSGSVSPNV